MPGAESSWLPQAQKRSFFKRVYWHVILTHFPLSFFMISALFMVLHLFTDSACFELAAFLCLVAGTVALFPAALSGWTTWRDRYRGIRTDLFLRKLRMAYFILPLGVVLVCWRLFLKTTIHTTWHYIYSTGIALLFAGVVAEGMLGGRLNHHQTEALRRPGPTL